MLQESIEVCELLLELKKKHLSELQLMYEKYKGADFLKTLKFLEWKKDKTKEEIAKFEISAGILTNHLCTLPSIIIQLENEVLRIEYQMKLLKR
jgi:hypothetical protein